MNYKIIEKITNKIDYIIFLLEKMKAIKFISSKKIYLYFKNKNKYAIFK